MHSILKVGLSFIELRDHIDCFPLQRVFNILKDSPKKPIALRYFAASHTAY